MPVCCVGGGSGHDHHHISAYYLLSSSRVAARCGAAYSVDSVDADLTERHSACALPSAIVAFAFLQSHLPGIICVLRNLIWSACMIPGFHPISRRQRPGARHSVRRDLAGWPLPGNSVQDQNWILGGSCTPMRSAHSGTSVNSPIIFRRTDPRRRALWWWATVSFQLYPVEMAAAGRLRRHLLLWSVHSPSLSTVAPSNPSASTGSVILGLAHPSHPCTTRLASLEMPDMDSSHPPSGCRGRTAALVGWAPGVDCCRSLYQTGSAHDCGVVLARHDLLV